MRCKTIVVLALVAGQYSDVKANTIVRDIELATDSSQIINGMFGAGVFWRPTFDLQPFTLSVGDTVDVTVRLDRPVYVVAGTRDLESAGAFLTSPIQSFDTTQIIVLDFLDVEGDLLTNHLTFTSITQGGIGGHTGGSVDLTDTWFSFQGFHYSIDITSGMGFPGVFDRGTIAVQTQGAIQYTAVPEPTGLSMGIVCCLALCLYRSAHEFSSIPRRTVGHQGGCDQAPCQTHETTGILGWPSATASSISL